MISATSSTAAETDFLPPTRTHVNTLVPHNQAEHERLVRQHNLIKNAISGQLILAPVPVHKPGLRILDSGTSSGHWLVDVAPTLIQPAALIGADIRPLQYIDPGVLPSSFGLIEHDIMDPWPADFRNTFDLVHQRLVLSNINEADGVKALGLLWDCVKPGGYLQLVEVAAADIERGPGHEGMEKLTTILCTHLKNVLTGVGLKNSTEALPGAKEVQLREFSIPLGAKEEEPAIAAAGVQNMLDIVDFLAVLASRRQSHFAKYSLLIR